MSCRHLIRPVLIPLEIEGETIHLLPEEIGVTIIPREGYVFANAKDLFAWL